MQQKQQRICRVLPLQPNKEFWRWMKDGLMLYLVHVVTLLLCLQCFKIERQKCDIQYIWITISWQCGAVSKKFEPDALALSMGLMRTPI